MQFINLTPHAISVLDKDGVKTVFEPSGQLARVSSSFADTEDIGGFNLNRQVFGDVEGLPESKEGVFYIVSALVLGQVKNRSDVVAPRTDGTAIRNDKGHIEAVRGFV